MGFGKSFYSELIEYVSCHVAYVSNFFKGLHLERERS